MNWYIELFLWYLLIINVVSFFITVYDKIAAQRNMHRISENTLMWISVLGGSVLMYITMKLIRHKTLHGKFMIGIPVIIVLQIILAFAVYYLV